MSIYLHMKIDTLGRRWGTLFGDGQTSDITIYPATKMSSAKICKILQKVIQIVQVIYFSLRNTLNTFFTLKSYIKFQDFLFFSIILLTIYLMTFLPIL